MNFKDSNWPSHTEAGGRRAFPLFPPLARPTSNTDFCTNSFASLRWKVTRSILPSMRLPAVLIAALAVLLAACGSQPTQPATTENPKQVEPAKPADESARFPKANLVL